VLKVSKLQKDFVQGHDTISAVNQVSFDLTSGETLAIVGPSGSGKTTLLSLLTGLEAPTTGVITIAGQEISSFSERQLSEFRAQNVGIVFQQFHLMPQLTAEENVALPLEILGRSNVNQLVHQALERVGLDNRKTHRPNELSGGECQRVAIARAMVVEPKILFADEPSGNLDTATGVKVMDLLFSLVEENKMTLVLITHDIDLAERCSRQLHMEGGHIQ